MSMGDRLRRARMEAGYKSATEAVGHFNWPSSRYRAHENGQNKFSPSTAQLYANAYGVSSAWLLLGEGSNSRTRPVIAVSHKHDCIEIIRSAALILNSDPENLALVDIIVDCANFLRANSV